jgi:hypothetical protein
MRRFLLSLGLALLVACAARPVLACAACGCGDQTLTAFGLEKPYLNRVRVGVEERYTEAKAGADAYGDLNRTLRSSLAVSWAPHKRITLGAMLPWMTLFLTPLKGGALKTVNNLGDLELSGRALLWADRGFLSRHLVWGLVGLKTPTGPRAYDGAGYPVDADVQPGSGSWDPFAGVAYGYFGGLVSTFASATYRYTTRGWDGYRFGSAFGASASAQLQPWWWGAAAAGFDLRFLSPDQFPNGHDAPDSGGTVLYFTPALLFTPTATANLFIRASVSIPFFQALRGLQLVGPQATLSVAYDFN